MRDEFMIKPNASKFWVVALLALVCSPALGHTLQSPQGSHPITAEQAAEERNQKLLKLRASQRVDLSAGGGRGSGERSSEYRIGADDLLEISVFEAPELNRTIRVASSGEFSLPPLGKIRASGLTTRELEIVLQELLRRKYLRDPHVGVYVQEMQSHSVSVFGAVESPGVYQIPGVRSIVEVLSMAGGLAPDAGDSVIVIRADRRTSRNSANATLNDDGEWMLSEHMDLSESSEPSGEAQTSDDPDESSGIVVNMKHLLESGDPRSNIDVYPGDIVKVARAGVVYVIGEVKKAGGFLLKTNESVSVLQALAMAEGLTATAAKSKAVIIRRDSSGGREEIAINLGKLLKGKVDDPLLQENDIIFVPNSTGKTVLLRGIQEAVRTISGYLIFSTR